jgi:HK97 family phage major capsid protein
MLQLDKYALRVAYDEKRSDAQRAWQAFADYRKEHGDEKIAKSTDLFKEAERLHKHYEAVAAEAQEMEKRMLDALIPNGKPGSAEVGRDGLRSIGKQFVARMQEKGLDGTSGGTLIAPFYDPQIRELPQHRGRFVRSLIPTTTADSDKVWFLRETVATQNAAPVAAGSLKPTSVYTVERVEEEIRTLAHLTEPLDRALLMDFEELTRFLDTQLRLGLLLAEDDQILNGDGTGVNLEGILTVSGTLAQARGSDSAADAIYKAITKIRQAFMEPTGIILNPSDWEGIRLSKDANANYLAGGVVESDPDRLWGLPVIASSALAASTAVVADFATGAAFWDREEARIEYAASGALGVGGAEIFSRNQVVFRAEERVAFAVVRPSAFCIVDLA